MRKVIVQLKPNRDNYTVDYISCFEKPLGIAIESLQPGWGNLFYICLKLMRAYYNLTDNSDEIFQYTREMMPRFGLKLKTLALSDDLISSIKAEIDLHNPVFVPGNLRELFYSYHYKTSDWEHLFLITGYDDDKNIFFVLDGCQKKTEEHKYEEFAIPFDVVTAMYESYKAVYPLHEGYAMEKTGRKPLHETSIILDCIDFLASGLYEQPYREITLMDQPLADPITAASISLPLFKIVKHKEVAYTELINRLKENFGQAQSVVQELMAAKNDLIGEWNLVINSYIINAVRKKTFDIVEKTATAAEADRRMRHCLIDVCEEWKKLNPDGSKEHDTIASQFLLENNEDGIIALDGSKACFIFRGDKLYNCWISDNSPKAMYRQTEFLREDFHLSVLMEVLPYQDDVLFQSGIVFRTVLGELYYWGVINGTAVMLSKIGDFQALCSMEFQGNGVNGVVLYIRKRKECYTFGFARKDGTEDMEVLATSGIGEITQIGIGCKTWDKAAPLHIEFSIGTLLT